ncbi:SDR family NAD(P)-dependent oxidoreductase [Arcticibacter tournemirensis]|uniref:SDR family NAD(P)-dependent oxidoreductase n=1 Tax=Arcticibacter tournemirensis TaxID=699437 RepID=A0A4V1KHW3_9SPHI|nr:SDR family NAD(P)-dependent oxidoreductase [Arcticibacter tournemirensis]RXF68592.1 SDR family NAD(P)-dependent oxidoreductase [Arcticibacter tournemirensis]
MEKKTWFITGASRGFGKEWTTAALQHGNNVGATARNVDALADLKSKFRNLLLPLQLDVI